MKYDSFSTRMKEYEKVEAGRKLMPLLPIMIRLDGKGFSNFTKGLKKPFDPRLSQIMIDVTKKLVEETNAVIGYTQSDEISLILYSDNIRSQVYFNGKIQKIVGDLTSLASLEFNKLKDVIIPEKSNNLARFDCRVWNVPNKVEASNCLLWREKDATKNSISCSAHHIFGHKKILHKSSSEKKDMLFDAGINWNDFPTFFKRGVFIQRQTVSYKASQLELDKLPPKHHARLNPDLDIERVEIKQLVMPSFTSVNNRVEVIFNGAIPTTC